MEPADVNIAIDQEVRAVARLTELLTQEQAALIAADIAALQPLLEEKNTLLHALNQAAQTRHRQLDAAGFSADNAGMTAWLAHQQSPALRTAWRDLQQALAQTKELNRINGLLIGKHASRNQQRLDTLQTGQHGTHVYGPNGQTSPQGRTRHGAILG